MRWNLPSSSCFSFKEYELPILALDTSPSWKDQNVKSEVSELPLESQPIPTSNFLGGFLMVVDEQGQIIFITRSVSGFLGLTQVRLLDLQSSLMTSYWTKFCQCFRVEWSEFYNCWPFFWFLRFFSLHFHFFTHKMCRIVAVFQDYNLLQIEFM